MLNTLVAVVVVALTTTIVFASYRLVEVPMAGFGKNTSGYGYEAADAQCPNSVISLIKTVLNQ